MLLQTLEPIIREHPFYRGLAEAHLKLIVECARTARFAEGEVLFREGDPADWFYLIREGLVAVEVNVPHGDRITLQTVGEGDVVGWSWLFPPYRWYFDAKALRPTQMLAFDGRCLRTKCEADHDLGYELIKRAADTLRERLDAARLQLLDMYAPRP